MADIALQIDCPILTVEKFAEASGIKCETVRTMIKGGRLPIMQKRRQRDLTLINMVALYDMAKQTAQTSR